MTILVYVFLSFTITAIGFVFETTENPSVISVVSYLLLF